MIEIPGYKIEKELGQGGMATVYLGVQEFVNRKVAIKVMSASLASDPSFTERFLKEANCANLTHNNIITVYDAGCIDNHHYIVMEYISGGDLSLAIEKGLEIADTIRIIKQIANALDYSFKQGYVHRDVKPDNILFREDGAAVLADFGIAKAASSATQLTGVGKAIGSPHYMSPEQTRGLELDGRSDLYSLGIVFYEMLTGSKPYDATDVYAIGMMHITEAIPVLPEKYARYQAVLIKLLAKKPDERYANAETFIRDLDAVGVVSNGGTELIDLQGKTTVVDMSQMQSSDAGGTTIIDASQMPGATDKKSAPNMLLLVLVGAVLIGGTVGAWVMMADKETPDRIAENQKPIKLEVPVNIVEEQLSQISTPVGSDSKVQTERTPLLDSKIALAEKIKPKPKPKPKPKAKPDQTASLLEKAQEFLDKGQLVEPKNKNAFITFKKILELEPGHSEAQEKLIKIANLLIHRAQKALNAEQLKDAELNINEAKTVLPNSPRLAKLENEVGEAKANLAAVAGRQFRDKLSDGSYGPWMIKISAGRFQMGDIQQSNSDGGERPIHTVNIPKMSVGKYEVSYEEYDKFAKASGRQLPDDSGWGREKRPVVNISWEDAKAYTQWLRNETGGRYRLLSESEWEYVARAGSDQKYAWGNNPGKNRANCKGCGSKWDSKKAAPVGSFKANKFGLYDLHGNVWEWVEDCWNDTYEGAPSDGSSISMGNCENRVLRGGSWNNYSLFMRSANRDQFEKGKKTNMFGFRVARDL